MNGATVDGLSLVGFPRDQHHSQSLLTWVWRGLTAFSKSAGDTSLDGSVDIL